jgi:hypothetical protein
MGLMDKVKAQAAQLAQQAQDTAKEGRARLDQAQANKRADVLLRNLGAAVYADQTGRGTPQTQEQIAQLIQDISAHEAENGINLASQPMGWQTAGATPGPDPAAGAPGPAGPPAPPSPFAEDPLPPAPPPPGMVPDPNPSETFPDPGASTTFPPSTPGTEFPQPVPDATFPGAGSTTFPEPSPDSTFPEPGPDATFPESDPGKSFPPES